MFGLSKQENLLPFRAVTAVDPCQAISMAFGRYDDGSADALCSAVLSVVTRSGSVETPLGKCFKKQSSNWHPATFLLNEDMKT